MYKIGWFSSGRGEGSRALLTTMQNNIETGQVQAEISFVFCNREKGQTEETDKFLDLVESYNIPLVCYSSVKFREQKSSEAGANWRIEYDRERMKQDCLESGFLDEAGPLAKVIYREWEVAELLMPYWNRKYRQAVLDNEITIEEAVDEFLMQTA